MKIYIVKYLALGDIEGYVESKKDFKTWIGNHNIRRLEDGEEMEGMDEFELVAINKLTWK